MENFKSFSFLLASGISDPPSGSDMSTASKNRKLFKFSILGWQTLRLALRLGKMGVIRTIFALFPHPHVLEKKRSMRYFSGNRACFRFPRMQKPRNMQKTRNAVFLGEQCMFGKDHLIKRPWPTSKTRGARRRRAPVSYAGSGWV